MSRPKVLYVCHNHPEVRPGGSEAYALALHSAMRDRGEFDSILLARTGPPVSTVARYHEGTLFTSVDGDPSQYFMYTDIADYDWFYMSSRDKELYTRHFREFLLAHRPDVVHFQHTMFFGYDVIRMVRNALPEAAIVYTLHEFVPICHRSGQMVRAVNNDELCTHSSPRRCHECFLDIPPQQFFLRKRFIQSHLALVDKFVTPSKFLLERYVEWGLPRPKLLLEENGSPDTRVVTKRSAQKRPRNRLGFFGQFTPFKGAHVLLHAMKLLAASGPAAHLWLHGSNLDLQHSEYQQEFNRLVGETRDRVTLAGPYQHADLPGLMASVDWVVVPSIWWENSPLVIQEAFFHGRPVICSDIGGMAEKVTDGVNGLHFRARDAVALAETIERAVATNELWEKLRKGIPNVHRMEAHVETLGRVYKDLLRQKAAAA